MSHTLIDHLTYNLWANERMGHLLMAQSDAILNAEQKSSFTSVTKTVMHLLDAEIIWLTRLKGQSLTDWPSKKFTGTKADMLQGLVKTSTELLQLIKEKGDEFTSQVIAYKNMKGDPYTNRVEEILYHVVNHGTYHRGQIITMLRGAGVEQVVSSDLIVWFREGKK